MSQPMFERCRTQFCDEGYFVIERAFSSTEIDLLRTVCSSAIEKMDAEFEAAGTDTIGINHRGKRYFIGQSYRQFPELGQILFHQRMADICFATLGKTAFLHNDQFVVKFQATKLSFAWHQDGAYVQAHIGDHPECITCWCALDDVDESNGTIYVLPISQIGSRAIVEHRVDPITHDQIGYFGDEPGEPIIAPAGSIVVFSSLVFHRSGPNLSGRPRRAYLAQYSPVRLQNHPEKWPQYLAESFLRDGQNVHPF